MTDGSKLFTKLRKVQTKLNVPKKNYNNYGKFYYRTTDDILTALKPLLDEHNLSLMITDRIAEIGGRVYVVASVVVVDCETDEDINVEGYAREDGNKGGIDTMQLTGAASTYARKYALNGLFLIDDTPDADHGELPKNDKSQADKKSGPKPPKDNKGNKGSQNPGDSERAFTWALQQFEACSSTDEMRNLFNETLKQARDMGLNETDEKTLRNKVKELANK